MSDSGTSGIAEAARNLSRSLAHLLDTAAGQGRACLQRAGAAVEAERIHRIRQVLLAAALVLMALLGAIFAGLAVIAAFWDTHRIAAIAGVAGAYLLLAATAAWLLWKSGRRRPAPDDWMGQLVALLASAQGPRR